MNWQFEAKLIAAFGLVGVVGCALCLLVVQTASGFVQSNQRVQWTRDVIEEIQQVEIGLTETETSLRGYLLTNDQTLSKVFEQRTQAALRSLDDLRRLTLDNPAQQQRLTQLTVLAQQKFEFQKKAVQNDEGHPPGPSPEILGLVKAGNHFMEEASPVLQEMQADESAFLAQRQTKWQSDSRRAGLFIAGLALLAVSMLAATSVMFQRDWTKRRRAEQAARTLNAELENLRRGTLGATCSSQRATAQRTL